MRLALSISLVLTLFFIGSFYSFAQPYGFEAHGIYAYDFNGEAGAFGQDKLDDVFGGGATFFFSFIPAVRVEFGADWIKTKDEDLDDSPLQISPLTAALRLGLPLGRFYIFGGGGLGYAICRLQPTDEIESYYAARGVYDLSVSNDLIYFAMAGAEFVISEHIGVRAEYRYSWLRTELRYDDYLGSGERQDLNLDHQQIRTGLVVYF